MFKRELKLNRIGIACSLFEINEKIETKWFQIKEFKKFSLSAILMIFINEMLIQFGKQILSYDDDLELH